MPLYYQISEDSERNWHEIMSKSMLVKNIEPDFSMPFNVNAVTNALLGFLFINMYNVIVKPKRFL